MPTALITGILGQDGHYLSWLLHDMGYDVVGLVTPERTARGAGLPPVRLLTGDLTDRASLLRAVEESQPDEVYNLGAITSVASAAADPGGCMDVNGFGALRLLEAVRLVGGRDGPVRFYQASSSEVFGAPTESPQHEGTPLRPRNPYGAAKAFAHTMVARYREAHGLYAVNGILYGHESPRRRPEFVTRKVTRAAARIAHGRQRELVLGDLDARRDWGFAGDYVRSMWLSLQQDEPTDHVVATGVTHRVRDLVELAFRSVGLDEWDRYVRRDERLVRPREATTLVGDASVARDQFGWDPVVGFDDLVTMMLASDLEHAA